MLMLGMSFRERESEGKHGPRYERRNIKMIGLRKCNKLDIIYQQWKVFPNLCL
ncbi:hypothetical protein CV_1969 [Chromobacterium violaceum ATCC 12472]|uniref:Uncharacterized protein n=1 Tax=Chromobacterium violaceum (strain ATCC 12472 / DSM 30191 / JCM 1249 / CCUG 213 / NBRC 12614 / NCIMB 9131 / NCTC 9757 / MK) TaxID=243365 RepID=Q7NWL4_CHRVO|nr:hypothetical protein CV_1969 [Chromobacterium violaceum ATCC 12472]